MVKDCTTCRHEFSDLRDPCSRRSSFELWEPGRPATGDLLADQRRLEWLLTVMSLEDDQGKVGGPRTAALAAALMLGKTGRDAIDFAMEGSP